MLQIPAKHEASQPDLVEGSQHGPEHCIKCASLPCCAQASHGSTSPPANRMPPSSSPDTSPSVPSARPQHRARSASARPTAAHTSLTVTQPQEPPITRPVSAGGAAGATGSAGTKLPAWRQPDGQWGRQDTHALVRKALSMLGQRQAGRGEDVVGRSQGPAAHETECHKKTH